MRIAPVGVLPFKTKQIDDLYWELCHVKDPRGRNRKFGIGTLLSIVAQGGVCGEVRTSGVAEDDVRLQTG